MVLNDVPANNVVIAVVCNTDYIYRGEQTRKQHFDYRLKMLDNIYQPAKAQLKWYNYRSNIRDTEFINGIESVTETEPSARFSITPARNVVRRGESVPLRITAAQQLQVQVRLYNTAGQPVYAQSFLRDGDFQVPSNIVPGVYILQAVNGREKASAKLTVR